MNKFLTFPGKQPVYLGDINFMQSAVGSALANLMKAYTGRDNANAIIYGVERSYAGASVTWTAGVVSIGGEILPVEAGLIADASGGLYFSIVSTTDGSRQFGDGQSHDCWEIRKATLTTTPTDYPLSGFKRVTPVDTTEAQVYSFDNIPNLPDRYARLANCGGAWVFALRSPAMAEESTTLFEGEISDLPDGVLQKFSDAAAPSSMFSVGYRINELQSIENIAVPATLAWSVAASKLRISISFPLAVQLTVPFEFRDILPIF